MTLYDRLDSSDGSVTFKPHADAPKLTAGIDVSLYQKVINWHQVKAAGVDFAYIKATQGNNITDPRFAANWVAAKSAGIQRGAYHFFKFGAMGQAAYFLRALVSDRGELSPAVDVEDETAPPDLAGLKLFIDALTEQGLKPIIYTGAWFWNARRWGGPVPWAHDYDLWAAWYPATPAPTIPSDWATWRIWQYGQGRCDGVGGSVDLNRVNAE